LGFDEIEVGFDDQSGPNGPFLALVARRGAS
jgi:hypothetical protein